MSTSPTTIETARTSVAPASLAFCSDEGRAGWVIATARPQVFVTLDWPRDGGERVAALISTFGPTARIVPMPGSYFQLSQYADDWAREEALPGFVGVIDEKIFLRAWERRDGGYEARWIDLATGAILDEDVQASICCVAWSLKMPVGVEDAVLHTFRAR